MKFYSFWRSLASFRVRIALNLKSIAHQVVLVDIDHGEQRGADYAKVNPQMALPSLELDDGSVLFQSLAILDYLNEAFPAPPLLPADAKGSARVPALALMVACEGHPLLVPRVRQYLNDVLKLDRDAQTAWRTHWIVETLKTLEAQLAGHNDTGRFCHGDAPTMADICMVGHVAFAEMLGIDLSPYPTTNRIFETAMALPAFAQAHPLAQPDTPEAARRK